MGYVPNLHPSRRWFAGRIYLKEALEKLRDSESSIKILEKTISISEENSVKTKEKGVMILSKLFLAELDVIRCLRTVFLLPPDDNSKPLNKLVDDLKEKIIEKGIPQNLHENFYSLLFKNHSIEYTGTAYYGMPNYDFYCNGKLTDSNHKFHLIMQAIKERINTSRKLLETAKEIMFCIYIEDKKEEIKELALDDYFFEEEFLSAVLMKNGIIKSEEDFKKYENLDPLELHMKFPEIFNKAIEEEILESMKNYYNNNFWKWKEEESIYFSHTG
ncbi:hypothetical protein SAMN06265339_0034 [Desulfurobacterium pacificum]|uniref:Uncharacterized protein n=1 Tax=Desulfurobacterium pacificum TaxID=240166 RepID=A0ABY1N9M1_9BACT|nr:hypothetical protein [Desulfurobacterium pacificum]SMP02233.1 hypothetical protein SAMN06265339_0034 [Desulfurobacterium pacificum]